MVSCVVLGVNSLRWVKESNQWFPADSMFSKTIVFKNSKVYNIWITKRASATIVEKSETSGSVFQLLQRRGEVVALCTSKLAFFNIGCVS